MTRKKTDKGKSLKKAGSPAGRDMKPHHEKVLEKRMGHFTQEVGALGERFGNRMDQKGEQWDSWFHRTFGVIGPVISSVFGILIIGLAIMAIRLVNAFSFLPLLSGIDLFLSVNIGFLFLIFLFFSYSSYFSRASPGLYRPFSPLVASAGITIAFWAGSVMISIANASMGIMLFTQVSQFVQQNLAQIFALLLVLAYAGYMIFHVIPCRSGMCMNKEETMSRKAVMKTERKSPVPDRGKRLYRSANDKILGGVCGGIAEYLGVDPVIIRLLWVIGTLAWGTGIIAYVIAWIIIPRNPGHRWED